MTRGDGLDPAGITSPANRSEHSSNGRGNRSASGSWAVRSVDMGRERASCSDTSPADPHAIEDHPLQSTTGPVTDAHEDGAPHTSDWPNEFSLDSIDGLSSLLIGLSSESDPFLLRHYLYNVHDTYRMFRLHFRKVVDDAEVPADSYRNAVDQNGPPIPRGPMPVQFAMTDEEIFTDDIKAAEKLFATYGTEKEDLELLNKLVPPELESRLLKL